VTALAVAWLLCSIGAVTPIHAEKAPSAMLSLTQADSGRTVDVRVGDQIQVTLLENATTGFRWAIDHYDDAVIEALGSEPLYTSSRVGSGGQVTFTFQGKRAGTGEIVLKHWRHFEGDASVTTRFTVGVNVQP